MADHDGADRRTAEAASRAAREAEVSGSVRLSDEPFGAVRKPQCFHRADERI
jgi:hypothetical protein